MVTSARHVPVLLMVRKRLVFWTIEPKPRSGTWKRRFDDLNRKGIGGVLEAVYATTLLQCCQCKVLSISVVSTYLGCAT